MSECNHDCGSCSANCDSRKADKSEFLEALNPASSVKKVIGVVSGKAGASTSGRRFLNIFKRTRALRSAQSS